MTTADFSLVVKIRFVSIFQCDRSLQSSTLSHSYCITAQLATTCNALPLEGLHPFFKRDSEDGESCRSDRPPNPTEDDFGLQKREASRFCPNPRHSHKAQVRSPTWVVPGALVL
ncbi:MAG: hypothetical protein ACM37W_06780 [Actinomycetota bacterium]